MWNECEQLWASRAAEALDARLTTHVIAPSVNPALEGSMARKPSETENNNRSVK